MDVALDTQFHPPCDPPPAPNPDFGLRDVWTVNIQPTGAPASGVRALMCSVLQDAIRCLMGEARPLSQRARFAAEARTWITEREAGDLFSFDSICSVLGLPAEALRGRLLRSAPDLPVTPVVARRTAPCPPPAAAEDILRRGLPLRAVAKTFGISTARIAFLYGDLARRVKVERNEEICRLRAAGWTQRALATRFGI
jgi:hypothetical protein